MNAYRNIIDSELENIIQQSENPVIRSSFQEFKDAIIPSHTTTSRRYSVWSLVRKHLDHPFISIIDSYKGQWEKELLTGYLPSTSNKVSIKLSNCKGDYTVTNSIEFWRHRLKSAIRSTDDFYNKFGEDNSLPLNYFFSHSDQSNNSKITDTNSEQNAFNNTLDCFILFHDFLLLLKPGQILHPDFGRILNKESSSHMDSQYCELCWRKSGKFYQLPLVSRRFCDTHNPSDPGSKYRHDHRYKVAFQYELDAYHGKCKSNYPVMLRVNKKHYDDEVRKFIYYLVRSKLNTPAREKFIGLRVKGFTPREIANQLGISIRAANKTERDILNRLRILFNIFHYSKPEFRFKC